MGTNAAYGGSGAAPWETVRDEWMALDTTSSGGSADSDTSTDTGEDQTVPSPADSLIEAIAQALIAEDAAAARPQVPTVPLSQVLPRRGGSSGGGEGGGGGGGGSRSGCGSSGTGRQITSQAARVGSAIGAAAAYRDRDAEALAGFGLTLQELDALSPRQRCARILDVAIGEAGHPDEQAMRHAALEQMKAILNTPADAPTVSGLEAIRGFISELVVRIGIIELRDQYLAQELTPQQAATREASLRTFVRAKTRGLSLAKYGMVSTSDMHQVARQMSADVLRLLRGK